MTLPTDAHARKAVPLATGCLDYFPDALAAVAELSRIGNEQHNPGSPLHWDRSKSQDEADALLRHLSERGTLDSDGVRHSSKVAWRALALLQKELEGEREVTVIENAFTPPVNSWAFGRAALIKPILRKGARVRLRACAPFVPDSAHLIGSYATVRAIVPDSYEAWTTMVYLDNLVDAGFAGCFWRPEGLQVIS